MGRPRKTLSLEEKLEKVNEEIEMYTEKIKSLKKRENWKKTWRIKKGRIDIERVSISAFYYDMWEKYEM